MQHGTKSSIKIATPTPAKTSPENDLETNERIGSSVKRYLNVTVPLQGRVTTTEEFVEKGCSMEGVVEVVVVFQLQLATRLELIAV